MPLFLTRALADRLANFSYVGLNFLVLSGHVSILQAEHAEEVLCDIGSISQCATAENPLEL